MNEKITTFNKEIQKGANSFIIRIPYHYIENGPLILGKIYTIEIKEVKENEF